MTTWMIAAFAGFIVWLSVRAMNRDKAARDRAAAIRARVLETHGVRDLFVSLADGSRVGLSGDGERVVIGQGETECAVPTGSIVSVEGMRDEAVLVRTDRNGAGSMPPAARNPADLPERIRSLSLRVTLEDGEHTVLFFDGGKHGVAPVNGEFRRQAAETEAWFRKLSNAMRPAA